MTARPHTGRARRPSGTTRRVPQQDRSREKVDAILSAARELVLVGEQLVVLGRLLLGSRPTTAALRPVDVADA